MKRRQDSTSSGADASERRSNPEERLRRSEALLQRAQRIAHLGSWEWDLEAGRVSWSDELHRIYGIEPGQFEGTVDAFLSRLHPEDTDRIHDAIERALDTGEPFAFEERILRPDGSVRVLDSQGEVERDGEGRVVRLTGICRDITERREAEARERELEERTAARDLERAAHERVRAILESITDAFFALDREWIFTYVNQEAGRLLQRPPAELLGRNVWELFPEAVGSTFQKKYQQAADSGESVEFVEYYPPLEAWYEVRAYPSADGLAVYFHDITAHREAEAALRRSEARFRFLADAIPQQVWTAAPDGSLDYVNVRVTDYFGRPADAVTGDGWRGVIHPNDLDGVVERWTHSLETGERYEVEFRLARHDGGYRWHLGRALAQKDGDGRILKWFGTNTDIHDQKEAEAARDRALEELRRSNAELDQFAYVASHDLKAPLRGIANLATWVEEDLGDRAGPETREHLGLLRSRVQRLEDLIDGLLQYSRAGRVRSSVERVDIRALVEEVVELLAPPEAVRVEIEGDFPVFRTERTPLRQVLLNLVGNALKYNDAATPVVTVAGRAGVTGAFHEFSVADNGSGIPPEFQDKIWGIFQTLQPRDRVESTGIGLAVVKKTVESHGGRVWLDSRADRGATFRFLWPADLDGEESRG